MSLEVLENRTLLSNVTVTFPAPGTASTLLITGDTGNDNFVIQENTNGSVTVSPGAVVVKPGVGVIPGSSINGNSAPVNTNNPVTSIVVDLPGTTNYDYVTLSGGGKTTATTVQNVTVTAAGANLTFDAGATATNGVDNSGNFVLSDTSTSSVDAVLMANVDNSSFATLSITQTGGGPDPTAVELGNDNISASVVVSEGDASGDAATVADGSDGGGVSITQGGGASDDARVNNELEVAAGDLSITQGGGSADAANVVNSSRSNIRGNIDIHQTDGAGNPAGDTATLSGDTVGGSIALTQGGAGGDAATVADGSDGGGVSITQGGGASDDARVNNELEVAAGDLSITQGGGSRCGQRRQ